MKPYSNTITNPFLCDECQQLGYCRQNRESAVESLLPKYYKFLSLPNPDRHLLEDVEIMNIVPVKTMVKDHNTVSGKKLQQAHDLFHQHEFEQASYLYRDLLMQRADYTEATVGLAASYYFLKQYEEASSIASTLSDYSFEYKLSDFLDACVQASIKPAIHIGKKKATKNSKTKVKIQ